MPQTVTVQLHPGSNMDRTVPALIQSIISTREWTGFCDEIDAVVQPAQKRMKMYIAGMFGGFILGGIILMVSFIFMGNAGFNCFPSCNGPQINAGVIIGPILILGSMCCGMYVLMTSGSKVESKIKRVCGAFSNKYPLLSVHYKTNTTTWRERHFGETRRRHHTDYFLEILVTDEPPREGYSLPVTYNEMEVPTANVVAVEAPYGSADVASKTITNSNPSATATTPAERMEQLEQMRGMLSEEEYEAKRTEILDSV